MLLTTGDGLFTVNLAPLETPPPGLGFDTVMVAMEPFSKSLTGTTAAHWVALVNVVCRATPMNSAAVAATTPVPLMVTLVLGLPAMIAAGVIEATTGLEFER